MDALHSETVAALLRVSENAPCGKVSRGRDRTLYDEIAGLTHKDSQTPLGRQAVLRLANAMVGVKEQTNYGRVLVDSHKDLESRSPRTVGSLFESFITMLSSQHPNLLTEICETIDPGWRKSVLGAIEVDRSRKSFQGYLAQYRESIKRQIREEFGTGEDWTNLNKVGLNAATVRLCGIFRKLTGGPQYGLVGQLLYRADLEDATGIEERDRYRKLAKRIGDRETRHGKS